MTMRLTKEPSLNSVFDAVFMQCQQNRWNFEKEEMEPPVSNTARSIFCKQWGETS